jgi:Caspase domain
MKSNSKLNIIFMVVLMLLGFRCLFAQKPKKVKSSSIQINFDSIAISERGPKIVNKSSIYGSQSPDSSNYHLLVISIQNYVDKDWVSLKWPIEDGSRLKNVLNRKYSFKESNTTVLLDPTRTQMFAVLQKYAKTLTKNDNLLIFYAGHGYYDQDMNMGYWIPSDGNDDNQANWFANDELKRIVKVINTQHTLVIADACFAGTLTRGKSGGAVDWEAVLPDNMLRSRYGLRSRKVMTSGSLEQVPDKSDFINSLVNILEESTLKYLTAEQLFDRLKKSISVQTPLFSVIPDCGHEAGGDFIFKLKK